MFLSTTAICLRFPREVKSRQLTFNMNTELITTGPCMSTKKGEERSYVKSKLNLT